jgi:DNA polymerase-3 subunit alpha
MFLIFDTETTGFPLRYGAPHSDLEAWSSARLVQLAWQIHNERGALVEVKNFIIKPDGFTIPYNAEKIHGISTERAMNAGMPLDHVLNEFEEALRKTEFLVGHNVEFDLGVVGSEMLRAAHETHLFELKTIDTKLEATDYCELPGGKGGKFKWPTLTELYTKLFGKAFDEAHNASADVEATTRAFLELVRIGVITPFQLGRDVDFLQEFQAANKETIQLIGLNIEPYSPISEQDVSAEDVGPDQEIEAEQLKKAKGEFAHLHNHTQFSILQSTTHVEQLVLRAKEMGMSAVAITDDCNMFGAFHFTKAAKVHGIKGIVGCELNLCKDHRNKSEKDNGNLIVLLAKNKKGYHNLAKLSTKAFVDGFYYVPRIDRDLLLQYKEDLMVISGGIFSEIPALILNVGEQQALDAMLWYKEHFKDDFYLELCRHGLQEEAVVNKLLIQWAKEYDIKLIAANNTSYALKEDAMAHDVLLCIKDAQNIVTPKNYNSRTSRTERFGLPNDEFYMKDQEEMKKLFMDIPEAIDNIQEVVDKCEAYDLAHEVLLPNFDIPTEFIDPLDATDGGKRGENAYLRHLTYEGAKKRYPKLTDEIKERLDFELETIEKTGYPGYFLIVQDFTGQARKMGVSVGPGRGSAAGSAVAYCTWITNVDPIKYDLLFERFLNPDRISLPDIDIDFDDRGRDKIIEWVVNKYGRQQVAQIITYGTMAAKSSVRDAARVMGLPLGDADKLAKLIPDLSLKKIFSMDEKELKQKLGDQFPNADSLRTTLGENSESSRTLAQAIRVEGTIRNTGVHPCGVIITPTDISDLIPVTTAKDSDLLLTQFDNSVVESAGLLKMDFLGLKTLTIINDAIDLIEDRHNIRIDPDEIPLDDENTYQLFQHGRTVGIFQYESLGMQKHLRDLKPDCFGDLIAMNALYRPGPLAYIPDFIKRKNGQQKVVYDLPAMEEFLKDTYGITVYQEQVMLLSQKLANFTKGEADTLRKGMGKKQKAVIDKMWPKFVEGCTQNGHPEEVVAKIWKDWEAFASYAFNKSHSTCYALIAYHTAYLKANYPAEFMASVLSNNLDNIKSVTFFMEECKNMAVRVLGPDVNESGYRFRVNPKGEIRFGMGAIKGVGEAAVQYLVEERKEHGNFTDPYDLVKRIDLRSANKRCLEQMILGGAWDSFGIKRSQYLAKLGEGQSFLDELARFGQAFQQGSDGAPTLFADTEEIELKQPVPPEMVPWGTMEVLRKEKEAIGIYLSGHPLDDYIIELRYFSKGNLSLLQNMEKVVNREMALGGICSAIEHRISKTGKPWGSFTIEDYQGNHEFRLFGETYLKYRHMMDVDFFLFVKGGVREKSWRNKDGSETKRLEFEITNIELLSEIREKMAKKITIDLELDDLDDKLLDNLNKLLSKNKKKGGCSIRFEVSDKTNDTKIELPSRSIKVEPSNDLFDSLQKMKQLTYKLN